MYIFIGDETNQQPGKNCRYFIYGGLFFPSEVLSDLDSRISCIRAKAGYRPGDELKFDVRSRPEAVSQEMATWAKESVVSECLSVGCRFIVNVTPHGLLKNQKFDRYVLMAADYVIGRYNYFLNTEANSDGICVIDRLPNDVLFGYLRDKSQYGLRLRDRDVPLNRIKLFAATSSNAANVNSAVDIVLGSFRYCINNPKNIDAAGKMMKQVVSLMWHSKIGGTFHIGKRGFIFRPAPNNLTGELLEDYNKLRQQIVTLMRS